jgi:phage terminase large subunit
MHEQLWSSTAPVYVDNQLVYDPFPKQVEFHRTAAKYRLYGGAKGGGKSFTLLWEAVLTCLNVPGCNVLLLRRRFTDLDRSLIDHFRKYIPAFLYGGERNFNQTNHVVRFPNGSVLFFGHCQHPGDEEQYNGTEWAFIGIDELTEWEYSMWAYLTAQVRCPHKTDIYGKRFTPSMAGATNPGGSGHAWVKNLWIDKKPAPGQEPHTYNPKDYAFIRSTVDDNPVYANDASYQETLDRLPTALREAWKLGNWDVLSGQYFDVFSYQRNVVPAAVARSWIKPWWPKWIAVDWGFAHYTSILWFTRGDVMLEGRSAPVQVTITYRELAINRTSERALAEEIAAHTQTNPKQEHYEKIDSVYLSHDAFNTNRYGDPVAQMIGEVLERHKMPQPTKIDAGPNSRPPGWRKMYQLLEAEEWFISDACPQLIDAIPQLMRSAEKPEDVVKTDQMYDDIADCARYGLVMALGIATMPFEAKLAEKLSTISDNHQKYMTHMKMLADRRKKGSGAFFIKPKRY